MNRFLSHYKTKADLTNYLAAKILVYNSTSRKLVITSSSGHTISNEDLRFQDNNHKKPDTLLIYQAVLVSQRNPPDAQMVFFSPDTDVLVLAIANCDLMLKNTSISRNYVGHPGYSFVCAAYSPKGSYIKTISELRWHLFCKHMAESDKLPPTLGALTQHVLRVHIQARVWGQASIALQDPQLDYMQNG